MATRVLVMGASGRTGREIVRGVLSAEGLELVGAIAQRHSGQDVGLVAGREAVGMTVVPSLHQALQETQADVLIDFSTAATTESAVFEALAANVRPIIGTTGLDDGWVRELATETGRRQLGGAAIANFSLGMALMFELAERTVKVFADAEILELHSSHKKDRPSGTALKLAEVLGKDVPIHSVRLPGLVAHQEVLFGGQGEVLTLRHDALSREAYVPGVLLTVNKVMLDEAFYTDLRQVLQ